jgi:hypothetical protein
LFDEDNGSTPYAISVVSYEIKSESCVNSSSISLKVQVAEDDNQAQTQRHTGKGILPIKLQTASRVVSVRTQERFLLLIGRTSVDGQAVFRSTSLCDGLA